jgi:uncharacterized phiE125 gp8 family phage protein
LGYTLITPPAEYPITLDEAKAHCRVTHDDEDALIGTLVRAATANVENQTGLSLMERTWLLTLDELSDAMAIEKGPVVSVASVKYLDGDGVQQTLDPALYTVDTVSEPQWIVRNSDASYPAVMDAINAVEIEYTAGHDAVPTNWEDIRHAILLLIGHFYMNREAVSDTAPGVVPFAVDALLSPYRRLFV